MGPPLFAGTPGREMFNSSGEGRRPISMLSLFWGAREIRNKPAAACPAESRAFPPNRTRFGKRPCATKRFPVAQDGSQTGKDSGCCPTAKVAPKGGNPSHATGRARRSPFGFQWPAFVVKQLHHGSATAPASFFPNSGGPIDRTIKVPARQVHLRPCSWQKS